LHPSAFAQLGAELLQFDTVYKAHGWKSQLTTSAPTLLPSTLRLLCHFSSDDGRVFFLGGAVGQCAVGIQRLHSQLSSSTDPARREGQHCVTLSITPTDWPNRMETWLSDLLQNHFQLEQQKPPNRCNARVRGRYQGGLADDNQKSNAESRPVNFF